MILNLRKPFDKNRLVKFDTDTGKVWLPDSVGAPANGNLHTWDGHAAALYSDGERLVFQIDGQKWAMGAPDLQLRYAHDLAKATTTFSVQDANAGAAFEYPAWWKGNPAFGLSLPELDEDEDYFAYVCLVWRDPDLQGTLIRSWS